MTKHVVVVGGGLAGTSAAYALTQKGCKVTIVEKNDYIGGRIHSHLVDGAAVEMGAGFMTDLYTNLRAFLTSTGMDVSRYRQYGSSGIYRNGRVRMATASTLLGNDALSWSAKFHAFPLLMKTLASWPQLDFHAFWKAADYDNRSVADMYQSPSSKEFLEYVIQPVLNGYFYWAPEHTSEAMLRILIKAAFSHGTYKMRGGLQRIPEKAAEGSAVLLNTTVTKITKNNDGTFTVVLEQQGKQRTLQADGIVCATTASAVPRIFPDLEKSRQEFFESIAYSSGALIARTYKHDQVPGDKAIAFPRREDIELSSVTASPEPGTGNATKLATVKTYASGSIGKELGEQSDEVITSRLIAAMEPIRTAVFVGDTDPVATFVQRWPEALPLFDVGHFKRLLAFHGGKIEDPAQAIVFCGDYIGGPFMEGAFTSGMEAADRLSKRLA